MQQDDNKNATYQESKLYTQGTRQAIRKKEEERRWVRRKELS